MVKCGSRCPAFYGIDCNLNPDSTERCELPYRIRRFLVSTPVLKDDPLLRYFEGAIEEVEVNEYGEIVSKRGNDKGVKLKPHTWYEEEPPV